MSQYPYLQAETRKLCLHFEPSTLTTVRPTMSAQPEIVPLKQQASHSLSTVRFFLVWDHWGVKGNMAWSAGAQGSHVTEDLVPMSVFNSVTILLVPACRCGGSLGDDSASHLSSVSKEPLQISMQLYCRGRGNNTWTFILIWMPKRVQKHIYWSDRAHFPKSACPSSDVHLSKDAQDSNNKQASHNHVLPKTYIFQTTIFCQQNRSFQQHSCFKRKTIIRSCTSFKRNMSFEWHTSLK